VLEVGAGHGAFTDHVLAMGAEVTVTEMSRPSLDVLAHRYEHTLGVRLVFDPDGEAAFGSGGDYDLILCVSVLHHIPNYESFVRRAADLLASGGVPPRVHLRARPQARRPQPECSSWSSPG